MKFDIPIKIYLHKEKDKVDISIKVSEDYVVGYTMKGIDFEYMLENWNTKGGINIDNDEWDWYIQHKRSTPRPESAPASFVRISISKGGIYHHHRVSYYDMETLQKEYFYQKNNVMHWDNSV